MSLNELNSSERLHIAFFGCRNAGKSSLVNAVTNQQLSVVSEIKGTTTDPVKKAMELLPIGPVVIIDTAGYDDDDENLGKLRVNKTLEVLNKTDIAVLAIDSSIGISEKDVELINLFEEKKLPYIIAYNKSDLAEYSNSDYKGINTSSLTGQGIDELRNLIGAIANKNKTEKYIIRDKLQKGDVVLLVIPIDESAPKGRIILPQQNVLREILDAGAVAVCCQVEETETMLKSVKPKFVITDSQVFNKVKDIVPENIILTSFSILMANYRGKLKALLNGVKSISQLKDGDTILISEGCTHHRQCNDIGTVKLPKWIKESTAKDLKFEFTQGGEFPADLSKYSVVIHCGGCMINEAEMKSRIERANKQNVPIVNYGMTIAYLNGILERAVKIFELGK